MEFTRTPLLPTSNDMHLVNWSNAHFEIWYGSMLGNALVPATLDIFTIHPV